VNKIPCLDVKIDFIKEARAVLVQLLSKLLVVTVTKYRINSFTKHKEARSLKLSVVVSASPLLATVLLGERNVMITASG
jgi:hypothetical protein